MAWYKQGTTEYHYNQDCEESLNFVTSDQIPKGCKPCVTCHDGLEVWVTDKRPDSFYKYHAHGHCSTANQKRKLFENATLAWKPCLICKPPLNYHYHNMNANNNDTIVYFPNTFTYYLQKYHRITDCHEKLYPKQIRMSELKTHHIPCPICNPDPNPLSCDEVIQERAKSPYLEYNKQYNKYQRIYKPLSDEQRKRKNERSRISRAAKKLKK